MRSPAAILLKRDLKIAFRERFEIFLSLMFQAIVVGVFPLSLSQLEVLPVVAVGYIWITLLLAMLLGTDLFFKKDAEDGSFYFWRQTKSPLWYLVLAKIICHFMSTALPLVLFCPLYAVWLHIPLAQVPILLLSLVLGGLSVSTVLSLGAALALLARGGAALQVLLVLPLLSPVIILGPQAIENEGALYGLMALACFFLSLLPGLVAFILDAYDE